MNNFYVDDALCGANTTEDVLQSQEELTALLGWDGFPECRVCPNHPAY
jgi:hypothetical protein